MHIIVYYNSSYVMIKLEIYMCRHDMQLLLKKCRCQLHNWVIEMSPWINRISFKKLSTCCRTLRGK